MKAVTNFKKENNMKEVTRFQSDNGEIYDFAIQAQRADKEHKDDKHVKILLDKVSKLVSMLDDIGRGKVNRIYIDEQKLQDYLIQHPEAKELVDEFIKETNKLEEK